MRTLTKKYLYLIHTLKGYLDTSPVLGHFTSLLRRLDEKIGQDRDKRSASAAAGGAAFTNVPTKSASC